MRTLCFALLLVASLTSAAQTASRFYLGAVADARVAMFKPTDGNGQGFAYPVATFGGGVGIACIFDVSPRLALSGYVQPFVLEKAKVKSNGFVGGDPDDPLLTNGTQSSRYAWSEFSSTILYKPLEKERFSVVVGMGFSARWSGKAAAGFDFESTAAYLYSWNFHLPFQAGTEFFIDKRWKIMCLAEYQLGLREIYQVWERSYKVNSIGLKIITVWAKRDKTAK